MNAVCLQLIFFAVGGLTQLAANWLYLFYSRLTSTHVILQSVICKYFVLVLSSYVNFCARRHQRIFIFQLFITVNDCITTNELHAMAKE